MDWLPTIFIVFLIVVAVAMVVVAFLVFREFAFWRYKAAGESALAVRSFRRALYLLRRAERVWDLNVTNQTPQSKERDIAGMQEVLAGIQTTCLELHVGIRTDEYREALDNFKTALGDFHNKKAFSTKSFGSAVAKLKYAQSSLPASPESSNALAASGLFTLSQPLTVRPNAPRSSSRRRMPFGLEACSAFPEQTLGRRTIRSAHTGSHSTRSA